MKRSKWIELAILVGLLLSGICRADEGELNLSVLVKGAQPNTGQVFLSLFSSEEDYLKEPFRYEEIEVNESGEISWTFKGLSEGSYAVSAIYDKNGNGKLDTGLFKIPKEPIGMSNDAKATFGPPSFKKTSFPLKESIEITIHLTKVKD